MSMLDCTKVKKKLFAKRSLKHNIYMCKMDYP